MATRKWGSEQLVNSTTTGDQYNAVTTVLKNGNFVVVWQNGSDSTATIRGQMFDAVGGKIGKELLINQTTIGDTAPKIAPLSDGGFIVVAEHASSPSDHDIYSFLYDANGIFKSRITAASSANEADPDVVAIGDFRESLIVWEDASTNSGDIYALQYNSDGSIRSKYLVNEQVDGLQSDPAVAINPGGGLGLAVWSDGYKIKGRLLNYDGPSGSEFQVNMPTADLPYSADVTSLAAGRFIVTWASSNQGGGGGIHARLYQVYSGYANAIGDEFFANSSSNGSEPTVTKLPNSGGFVVSWSESNFLLPTRGPDTSGSSIHLQAFDGSGAKIGGEIIVNTTMADSQYTPSVTALLDDRVVVTWTDASMTGGDTSGRAVRMQIVDPRDGAIYGSGGADTLYGNDFINDEISGGDGADKLFGLRGDDNMFGGDGDDTMIGGLGADTMTGGAGRDTASYVSSSAGVTVDLSTNTNVGGEASGDQLSEIENLAGSGFADTLRGDAAGNTIDGGKGTDTLFGRQGNDTYVVDNAGDRVIEARGEGADRVVTSVSYTLTAGQEIETLATTVATSTVGLNLTGNEFANTITGNAGGNVLNGGAGADTLIGGAGNDIYVVDNAGDQIFEAKGGGADRIVTSVSYTLGAGQEVETLATTSATGTAALNLMGNEFANTIAGNAGANVLNGGLGGDTLSGGAGKDTFVFATALGAGNVDRIADFSIADDKIQLSKSIFTALSTGTLAASAFKDLGVAGATVDTDDRILYNKTTGAMSYDADGSGAKAAVQFAVLDNKAALTHADFLIG